MLGKKPLLPFEIFPAGLNGIIFDVDGVLFDSRSSNVQYYNLIRRAVDLPPLSKEEEDYCVMASVKEALERIIPKHLSMQAEEAARKINYREHILPMLMLEDGLLEALHWLQEYNINLGVCTNRTNSVESLFKYFGLENFFSAIKTAENSNPKPNPQGLLSILAEWNFSNNHVLFIGDSIVDQQAAHAAGLPFCAFKSTSLQANIHMSSFFELINWLTPLIDNQKKR